MEIVYMILVCYSLFCAPDLWFKIFKFNDSPEYAFIYLIGCIFFGLTLMGAVYRVVIILRGAMVKDA